MSYRDGHSPNPARGLLLSGIFFFAIGSKVLAQDIPAVKGPSSSPGFQLPQFAGTLNYALSASQSNVFGYSGDNQTARSVNLSGDVAFVTPGNDPFSLIYSGGYLFATSQNSNESFQNLAVSQVLSLRKLHIVASDAVSYLPSTPSTGLSGIAGLGDLGIPPVQVGPGTADALQSTYGTRINNSALASVSYPLTGKTSANASGGYAILRFPGEDATGISNDIANLSGGLSHQLNARESFYMDYSAQQFSYPGVDGNVRSQSVSLGASVKWTRRLSVTASVGPQYVDVFGTKEWSYTVHASSSYALHSGSLAAEFDRDLNSGSGVTQTTRTDSASMAFTKNIAEFTTGAATFTYSHIDQLPTSIQTNVFSADSYVAGGQVSRSISRRLSVYASYTAQHQATTYSYAFTNALNGFTQTVGFGLTYSSKSITFSR